MPGTTTTASWVRSERVRGTGDQEGAVPPAEPDKREPSIPRRVISANNNRRARECGEEDREPRRNLLGKPARWGTVRLTGCPRGGQGPLDGQRLGDCPPWLLRTVRSPPSRRPASPATIRVPRPASWSTTRRSATFSVNVFGMGSWSIGGGVATTDPSIPPDVQGGGQAAQFIGQGKVMATPLFMASVAATVRDVGWLSRCL